eukprot:m.49881 g.49881  ORF g.49881 m.49881 type:complete len:492 (-) comp7476_c0_seq4:100-1575(-)
MTVRKFLQPTIRNVLEACGVEARLAGGVLPPPPSSSSNVIVSGWVRLLRKQKKIAFASITDGTTDKPLQVVLSPDQAHDLSIGASVTVTGDMCDSPGKGQEKEIHAKVVELVGESDPKTNPIQPKFMTPEFLRTIPHLRLRTSLLSSMMKVRSTTSHLLHNTLDSWDFLHIHTPILTSNDCEGSGEVFSVSSSNDDDQSHQHSVGQENLHHNLRSGLFSTPMHLTVSGQLHLETITCGVHPRSYTFGPTFRAENSNTPRHLSEFYMLEGEIAFADLESCLALQEELISTVTRGVVEKEKGALELLWSKHEGAKDVCNMLMECPYSRISYTESIRLLKEHHVKFPFKEAPMWGNELGFEHEQFIAQDVAKGPVFITHYPRKIKPFYMLQDNPDASDDGATVSAADLIIPHIGELTGGSAREHRVDLLQKALIDQIGVEEAKKLDWYVDLRKYGTIPHAGFGLGFERLLRAISGMQNVRDVIPFPRHPGTCYL